MKDINLTVKLESVKEAMGYFNYMTEFVKKEHIEYVKFIKHLLLKAPLVSIAVNIQLLTPLIKYMSKNRKWADKYGATRMINEALALRKAISSAEDGIKVKIIVPTIRVMPDKHKILGYHDAQSYKDFLLLVKDLDSLETENYAYIAMHAVLEGIVINRVPIVTTSGCRVKDYSNSVSLNTTDVYYNLWCELLGVKEVLVTCTGGEYASGQGYLSIDEIRDMMAVPDKE